MRRYAPLLLTLPLFLTTPLSAQTHPNLERGMSVGKAYQVGDVDSVSLFNGNLSIAIPLGQRYSGGGDLSYSFVLRYNSNVWDHHLRTFTNDCTPPYKQMTVTETTPHQVESGLNAGLGWSLDFGTLLLNGFGTVDDLWTYVSPDGSTHPFYWTMHEGETPRGGYRYTRDGSFMRLAASSYSAGWECSGGWLQATVDFADGRRQTFSRMTTCHPFSLNSEIDRFGNSLTFTRDTANNRLAIHDSQGRDHYIGFTSLPGFDYPGIAYVDLAAFDDPGVAGAQRARYSFSYDTATIARSCKHYYDPWWDNCDPQLLPTLAMSFLTGVSQPDGSEWSMLNGTTLGYNLDSAVPCAPGTPRDRPGTINHLKNPVGGTYDWTYATWRNPEGGASCYSSPYELDSIMDSTGVYDRTLTDPFNASGTGLWQYRHDSWHLADGTVDPSAQESWTTVTSPEGDQSKHYFRTQYCGAGAYEGWDYGLPYTKGRYGTAAEPWVSSQQYDGSASVPANLKRTSFLRYEPDALNASWTPSRLQQSNRRVNFEKTVFADDPNAPPNEAVKHYTTVNYSDYDGLGHFRVITTGGDFGSGNTRQTTTAFNPFLSYPPATPPAQWWPYDSPWVINTYASSKVAEGGSIAKAESCFDWSTGYLWYTRALKLTGTGGADPAQSTSDVITRRTHTSGDTTREESFGGDTQYVNTGELCSLTLPAAASYRVDHTYQYGSLKTSRYADSAGSPLSFYLVDRDIDPSTGLVTRSRDSAGVWTDFVYDTMGRLTRERPQTTSPNGGGWVSHCYVGYVASPLTSARVDNFWWPNGDQGTCAYASSMLRREAVDVDGFGRTWRELRRLFDGSWAQRLATYNGMGWTTSVSEWQQYPAATVKKTEYLGLDPFGRPGTIRPADGSAHDMTLAYSGIRLTSRSAKIATAVGSETTSTTTEEYDRQGRLWKVTEPSDASGADVTTTYSYDVGGRLKQASTPSVVTQNRIFTYDNRGFLASEQLPEVGASGNGTITYSKYDARGHAHRIQDGAHDLAFTYDVAERLTQVAQADSSGNSSTPVVKTLSYASANGASNWKNGKLETATSHNPDLTSASVVESYAYGGLGGRVSSRQTQVEGRMINQAFTWNDLGLLSTLGYPDDTVLTGSLDPARTISYNYSSGSLVSVPSYLTSISYHPNGLVHQVQHANGVRDLFGKDPNDLPRPSSIAAVYEGNALWQTGVYSYDGVGNVKTIGQDWYTYDPVSRLSVGTTMAGVLRQCATYNAFGSLTSLGTGVSGCTMSGTGVDAATNRLGSPVTYDAAGNTTAWDVNSYSWNRGNQIHTTTGSGINRSYGYTADGERISDRNNQDSTRTLSIRDLSGRVLREYGRTGAGSWSWSKDYVYRDGQLTATVTPTGPRHLHLDHLGTVRRMTDTQAVPQLVTAASRDFYPFGMEATTSTDPERMRFTGHQRDTYGTSSQTDDLDYMHARFYTPTMGRFLSLDPGRDINAAAPQSWNLYAYARNNPVKYTDPDGRLFQLAGCASGNGSVCGQEQRALQASVGKSAAKYLVFGKGGRVTLSGISAKAFGTKFGTVAGGLGRLIANKAATFTLDLGNPKMANATDVGLSSGGARFQSSTGTIFADPSKFPLSKGGVSIDTTEAVVHEMGHALATLYQGLSAGIDAATNPRRSLMSNGEGYATSFENHYRREILGVGDSDIRAFYGSYGDYVDPGQIPLFPQ